MLKAYVRDSSYFQIVKNSGQLLTGYVFDNQFSLITNYINNKVVPTLDNLKNNGIHGVLDSAGYLLRNIGDKTTEFSRLRGSDIRPFTISLDKFRRIAPNSVGYCNTVNLNYITCEDPASTLLSGAAGCSFSGIKAVNIEDSTITNDRVALNSLTLNHLNPDAVTNIIDNIGLIPTIKIADRAITGDKVAERAYTNYKMSHELLATRDNNNLVFVRADITQLASDNRIFDSIRIADDSINFSYMFGNNPVLTSSNVALSAITLTPQSDISPYSIFNDLNLLSVAYIKNNSFTPKNNSVAADGISKAKLSQAIIQKLRVGGLVV